MNSIKGKTTNTKIDAKKPIAPKTQIKKNVVQKFEVKKINVPKNQTKTVTTTKVEIKKVNAPAKKSAILKEQAPKTGTNKIITKKQIQKSKDQTKIKNQKV